MLCAVLVRMAELRMFDADPALEASCSLSTLLLVLCWNSVDDTDSGELCADWNTFRVDLIRCSVIIASFVVGSALVRQRAAAVGS